jgi:endonuclease/exonuclease/phosphatase family metal-dependent hydrolase
VVSFFKRKSFWAALFFTLYGVLVKTISSSSWLGELLRLGLSFILPLFFFALVYLIIKRKKNTWLLLLPTVLFSGFILDWFAFSFPKQKSAAEQLKVASFNTATLDVRRFAADAQSPALVDYTPMFDWVRKNNDVDVLCLQEFYDSFKPGMKSILDSVVTIGGFRYYCINPSFSERHKGFFGVIVFSKIVPDNCERFIYGNDKVLNKGIYLDFLSPQNDTLRILNVHLASMSIRFENEKKSNSLMTIVNWFGNTYKRLKTGFEHRDAEMKSIERFLQSSPTNTIVCGDFNATPHMNANTRMRAKFNDAFLKAGMGWGFSYHHFPYFIKIDYQYFRGKISATKSYVDRSARFSDHYPLISDFEIPFSIENDQQKAEGTSVIMDGTQPL